MAKYVIVSTAVTDDIWLADGTHIGSKLGGAGIYAYSGLRIWCEDTILVSGIGKDFFSKYEDWFVQNNCSTNGLTICDEHTPFTHVRYDYNGERIETSKHGRDHYRKMEATPEQILPFLADAKGVYIFQSIPEGYWEKIIRAKQKYGFKLEWELNAKVASPAYKHDVEQIAKQCDVLSLNRAEAFSLFDTEDINAVSHQLKSWNIPMVYLRLGSDGGLIIRNRIITHVPPIPDISVADPTGAGNSSSAAVLYGFCEGYSDLVCGFLGSISAAKCIEQYGPPEIKNIKRENLLAQLKAMVIK